MLYTNNEDAAYAMLPILYVSVIIHNSLKNMTALVLYREIIVYTGKYFSLLLRRGVFKFIKNKMDIFSTCLGFLSG